MAAFAAHPQRFIGQPAAVPAAVWINPPTDEIVNPEIIIPGAVYECRPLRLGSGTAEHVTDFETKDEVFSGT